jgi:hypothetical protein
MRPCAALSRLCFRQQARLEARVQLWHVALINRYLRRPNRINKARNKLVENDWLALISADTACQSRILIMVKKVWSSASEVTPERPLKPELERDQPRVMGVATTQKRRKTSW